jgi:uncharacterized protein (DUF983 family)
MTGYTPRMTDPVTPGSEPSILQVGFKSICPRCGARTLFDGYIRFARACRACGLDYEAFNVGDGPAAFLTLIIGTIVCIAAITLELVAQPPFWVHILLWVPITLGLVMLSLRVAKGMLIASEYRNRAREGRVVEVKREP